MDDEQFERLYLASRARLVGQVYVMTGDMAEAQDCVQEAFARAWPRRRTLDADGAPEAWIRTTAWRLSVSRWRRAASGLRAHRRHGVQPDLPGPGVEHLDLARALQSLNPDQRRAIVLHYLCDLSVEQVSAETGAPASTVKTRLHRGRAALAAVLAPATHLEVPRG